MRKYRLSEQTRQYCYQEEDGKQCVPLRGQRRRLDG